MEDNQVIDKLSYEEAYCMISNPLNGFEAVTHKKHVVLSPKYIGKVAEGVHEILRQEMRLYSDSLKAIPLSYKKPRLIQTTAYMIDINPYMHFDIEVDYVVFKPQLGSVLKGKVNKLGGDHVGLLVHGTFNAVIHKPNFFIRNWAGSNVSINDEVTFKVVKLQANHGLVSIYGAFMDDHEISVINKNTDTKTNENVLVSTSVDVGTTQDKLNKSPKKHIVKANDLTNTAIVDQSSEVQPSSEPVSQNLDISLQDDGKRKKKKKKDKKNRDSTLDTENISQCSDPLIESSQGVMNKYTSLNVPVNASAELNTTESSSQEVTHKKKKKKKDKGKMDKDVTPVKSIDDGDVTSCSLIILDKNVCGSKKRKLETLSPGITDKMPDSRSEIVNPTVVDIICGSNISPASPNKKKKLHEYGVEGLSPIRKKAKDSNVDTHINRTVSLDVQGISSINDTDSSFTRHHKKKKKKKNKEMVESDNVVGCSKNNEESLISSIKAAGLFVSSVNSSGINLVERSNEISINSPSILSSLDANHKKQKKKKKKRELKDKSSVGSGINTVLNVNGTFDEAQINQSCQRNEFGLTNQNSAELTQDSGVDLNSPSLGSSLSSIADGTCQKSSVKKKRKSKHADI